MKRPSTYVLRLGAKSGGEANYYRLVIDAGLPVPTLQIWMETVGGPKRLEACWEELTLGCEIDGERYHGAKCARDRDRFIGMRCRLRL
ncbi:MAG: hypothetical protein R2720_07180 [Candidatus Nanopelagicales bacterium]